MNEEVNCNHRKPHEAGEASKPAKSADGDLLGRLSHSLAFHLMGWRPTASRSRSTLWVSPGRTPGHLPRPHVVPVLVREVLGLRPPGQLSGYSWITFCRSWPGWLHRVVKRMRPLGTERSCV